MKAKLRVWSRAKSAFIYPLKGSPLLYRYDLLLESYKEVARDKLSSVNGSRQIFLSDDSWYNRSAIAHWERYFFNGEFQGDQVANISEDSIAPGYISHLDSLESNITVLKNAVQESFNLSKHLFASTQTEFSAYSIAFAILAIIISSILGLIPLIHSSKQDSSNELGEQSKSSIVSPPNAIGSPNFSGSEKAIAAFETSRSKVRIFTQNNQVLMNLYDKRSKVTRMNSIPVSVEQVSGGTRYTNPTYKVVVEVSNVCVLYAEW